MRSRKFVIVKKYMRGYVALVSVLLIGAVTLLFVLGTATRGLDEAQMALGADAALEASARADLCAEYALMRLSDTFRYAGGETVLVGSASCEIRPVVGMGNTDRVVEVQSTIQNRTRNMRINVSRISPVMNIASWHDVADF